MVRRLWQKIPGIKRPVKIHTQIFIALVAGALFGGFFHIDHSSVVIVFKSAHLTKKHTVKNWREIRIDYDNRQAIFTSDQTQALHGFWRVLAPSQKGQSVITVDKGTGEPFPVFRNVKDIEKQQTVATAMKPVGVLFIRLLNMIAIPLVLGSLIVGAASLGNIRKVARVGAKTFVYYMVTTAIAITIGLVMVNIIQPGVRINAESKQLLMAEFQVDIKSRIEQNVSIDIVNMFVEMVPTNIFKAVAEPNMLQIIFFAVFLGIILTLLKPEKSTPMVTFFDSLSESMIEMVQKVMYIAPYAVFALVAATVSEFGFGIIKTLIWYICCVLLGLFIHCAVTYPAFLKIFTKVSIKRFFRGMRPAQLVAFSTSSSAATLPVNFECCEKNLGVPKSITSFVLPLGATINMDGTALYQAVAANFIAQVYGIELTFTQQLIILLTALLASIGTAPVPGVGIIMLIIILKSVGVPEVGIALILGVDRFLDMCRTVLNITGDAAGSVVVSASEEKYQNSKG